MAKKKSTKKSIEDFRYIYDNTSTRPFFLMLVGLPASGKSTLAEKIKKADINNKTEIVSSDNVREFICGDVNNQEHNEEVFSHMYFSATHFLALNINVIYDATNISYKKRKTLVDDVKTKLTKDNKEADYYVLFVATEYSQCLLNNSTRERKVPEEVITRMYKNFDIPAWYEGWDRIFTYYPSFTNKSLKSDFDKAKEIYIDGLDISHDNPHHSLMIGEHCRACLQYLKDNTPLYTYAQNYYALFSAAIFHDIGKPFCKTFKNSKGEITEVAHYYNHEHVGSYLSMFMNSITPNSLVINSNLLLIAALIRWHMRPWLWEKEGNNAKLIEKDKKLWSIGYKNNELGKLIEVLHKADREAH